MLQQRILQTLEKKDNVDQRKLSRIAGVNESTISRYLHGYETLNLASVLKIIKELYPDQEREIMAEYVLTQRSKNARFALEYCEMNNLPEQSKQLIEILTASVNPVDKEWAFLYQFIRHLKDQTLPLKELQAEVEVFKPKELEMKIMKMLVKAYISSVTKDYHSLILHINGIEHLIKEVKSDFLRNCYNIRLGLIMNYVSLYANDIEGARYYNSLVINQEMFENVKAIAYHHLGHSFMYEDYDKSKHYLEEAMKMFMDLDQKDNFKTTMYTFSFLQSYWKKDRDFNIELSGHQSIANYIFFLIQKEDITLAEYYLGSIDVTTLSDWDKGFHYFYEGLICKDKKSFYYSVLWFIQSGDAFHLQLPIEELRKLGEDEVILQIFMAKVKGGFIYNEKDNKVPSDI